jgi:hypothetical protein
MENAITFVSTTFMYTKINGILKQSHIPTVFFFFFLSLFSKELFGRCLKVHVAM